MQFSLLFFFLLITLHTFIKTTTDYNLTICVKKRNSNKTPNPDCSCFSSANCTVFFNDYLDSSLASISPVTGKSKKSRLHCNTLFTVYYLYIYIIYIFIYIYITLAVIMTRYIHEHH